MILIGRVHRIGLRLLLGTCCLLMTTHIHAQRTDLNRPQNSPLGNPFGDQNNQMQYGNTPGVQDNNAPQEKADTTQKPPKIRKPLESYLFGDTLRKQPNFVWNVNMERNGVTMTEVDTMLMGFQNDYPFMQNSVGAAYLGTLGSPATPLDYFARPQYRNFSFAQTLDSYLVRPETANFYNVKKPFTHLSYFMSGQVARLEESLWATHAQNVSPTTGFNIDYKSLGTRGLYMHQKTRDKNFSAAFSHTGKKYTLHAGYIYNTANLRENGGIKRDSDITDTVYEQPDLVEVRMSDARNLFKNNTFYLVQSYGVPLRRLTEDDFSIADQSTFYVGHSFEYSRFWRKYTDTKEGAGDYYQSWYLSPELSRDSTFESLLSNRVFVQIQPWSRQSVVSLIDVGAGNDMHSYYQFRPQDYLQARQKNVTESSTYLFGSIRGQVSKYLSWNAHGQYHPFGYRSQDLKMGGELDLSVFTKGRPITLSGSVLLDRRTPDYWSNNYFSNHFVWSNSFGKETETQIAIKFAVPHRGIELGAHQSITTGKIYFDAQMLPAQSNESVSVSSLYAKKDFRIGGLHLNNRVLLQFSDAQEVVPVPMASAYLSYFYEFNIVKGVLRLQLGVDGRYNTKYYAFGYNPATAQFFNQREKKLGGYPMLDLFAAAKWKRMRILVKLQHANEDLFGERNYFSVLHYPLNGRMFKMGFSWTFYD